MKDFIRCYYIDFQQLTRTLSHFLTKYTVPGWTTNCPVWAGSPWSSCSPGGAQMPRGRKPAASLLKSEII